MKHIELTKGKVALVDDQDYERVNRHGWSLHSAGYAACTIKYKAVLLHNFVNPPPEGLRNDHINQDKLDNRKSNLRFVTCAQNQYNRGLPKNNTTGYKGVAFNKQIQKYVAQIRVNGKLRYLGCFPQPEEAAKAYDNAALELVGSICVLNFPAWSMDERHKVGEIK